MFWVDIWLKTRGVQGWGPVGQEPPPPLSLNSFFYFYFFLLLTISLTRKVLPIVHVYDDYI